MTTTTTTTTRTTTTIKTGPPYEIPVVVSLQQGVNDAPAGDSIVESDCHV
jgi:hypothetical protein